MKSWMTVCFLVLSCLYISPTAAQQKVDRVFVANAIKIELSVKKSSFSPREPVMVTVTVTNTAKQTLYIPGEPFDWTVLREDGGTVSETPFGKKVEESKHAEKRTISIPLEAGESASVEENLSRSYVMDSPGAYLLSAEREIGDETGADHIKSNTLRITIQ